MEAFRKTPSQISFKDTVPETFRTPSRPLRNLSKSPSGRPSAKPPSKTPSEPPSFEDPLQDVPKPPFEALRRAPRVPKPPSEPSRSPAGCPFRSSDGTSFGSLRSMTPVPKANPEASFGTGHFEPLSETPSERATCPRVHREAPRVIIPGSLRMHHVSPEDSECDATLPEAPECAESPANDIYSGCPRMRHVSPEAPSAPQASRKLPSASRAPRVTPPRKPPNATPVPECLTLNQIREPCEYDACPEDTLAGSSSGCSRASHVSLVAEPREPLPGALRVGRAPSAPPGSSPSALAREPRTERLPGHSASTPRVPGSASLPAQI